MKGCVHTMVELRKLHIRYVSTYSSKLFPSVKMCISCQWNRAKTTSGGGAVFIVTPAGRSEIK